MPVLQDQDIPTGDAGPNASLPFGGAEQMQGLAGELGKQQQGPSTPQAPGAGAPMARPSGAAPPPPPVQPSPVAPMPFADPGSRLNLQGQFSPLRMSPTLPVRNRLRVWAGHPQGGPFLGAIAEKIRNQTGPAEPNVAGQ